MAKGDYPGSMVRIPQLSKGLKDSSLRFAAIPIIAKYPVLQHQGRSALPVVRVGDRVEEGMLLAKATTNSSCNIHSAVPGEVKAIVEQVDYLGRKQSIIEVSTGGRFRVQASEFIRDYSSWSRTQFLAELAAKGVIDFDSSLAINEKWQHAEAMEYLIVNTLEFEPYLASSHRLLVERTKDIISGLIIALRVLKPQQVVFVVAKEAKELADELLQQVRQFSDLPLSLIEVQEHYLQATERALVYHATQIRLGTGQAAKDASCVITHSATLLACYEALAFGKPLVDRAISVAGQGVKRPGNLIAKLGTPLMFLIEECGGFSTEKITLIAHGPMMGQMIIDEHTPLTREMAGIVALVAKESKQAPSTACIGCTACVKACPLKLLPKEMYHSLAAERVDMAEGFGLKECITCGACSFSCPARLELSHAFAVAQKRQQQQK